jgi:galactonate dehydratase
VRIARIQTLAADGGSTSFHFLKITTDDGTVGWSEFGDGRPAPGGIAALIAILADRLIGRDPRQVRSLTADLTAATRFAGGGTVAQAIAAIENACLDLTARALGVPVHELLGGAQRGSVPLYWSHCGMYRALRPDLVERLGLTPVRTVEDMEKQGAEVRSRGFRALKTNLYRMDGDELRLHGGPASGAGSHGPALEATPSVIDGTRAALEALRRGAGDDVELMVDANFGLRVDGSVRLAAAIEHVGLRWLEVDMLHPQALEAVKRAAPVPIASLETVLGIRDFAQYFPGRPTVDVAIIDVMWNGLLTSLSMASTAEVYEISIAPHVYAGPLSTVIGVHFALMAPNVAIMEYDVDAAPWRYDFLTRQPTIEAGLYTPPDGPGWGCEIDESALEAHPLRNGMVDGS